MIVGIDYELVLGQWVEAWHTTLEIIVVFIPIRPATYEEWKADALERGQWTEAIDKEAHTTHRYFYEVATD